MDIYYMILFGLAALNLIIFIFLYDGRKINNYFLLIAIIALISNAGFLALSQAKVIEEAILASKLASVGGSFISYLLMMSIFKMCNIKMPKIISNILFLFSAAIYIMELSLGYTDIFYSSVELKNVYGISVLSKASTMIYELSYIILYLYMLVSIIILFISLIKKHAISQKNLWALIILNLSNVAVLLVNNILLENVEIMPIMYVIDGFILIYLCRRVAMYSLEENISASIVKQQEYGYIMFDNHKNYLGCNQYAMNIFPEFKQCKIDLPIYRGLEIYSLVRRIDDFVDDCFHFELEKDGHHYEFHVDRIWRNKKAIGYSFEFEDNTEKWKYMNLLANSNNELESQVKDKSEHISNIQAGILLGMANIVENRDNNTGGHIKRTSDVIKILIDTMRKNKMFPKNKRYYNNVINAAPMHDLGKIAIDDRILKKKGRLTPKEFSIMQTHAEKSAQLVESILGGIEEEDFVRVAVNIARFHHEKWNGEGYPKHLKGEEIPLEARIMAIADVYDALVSKRCYKEPMSFEDAYNVMISSMGTHFDPGLEEIFIQSRKKLEEYYKNSID